MSDLMMRSSAVFSPCRRYRYALTHEWDDALPMLLFCGQNPSTADEKQHDNTSRRVLDFAIRWKCGSLRMVNMNAWIATEPRDLRDAMLKGTDVCGAENDDWLHLAALEASERNGMILVAWGALHRSLKPRARAVEQILLQYGQLWCLGATADCEPRHPLFIEKNYTPQGWGVAPNTPAGARARTALNPACAWPFPSRAP